MKNGGAKRQELKHYLEKTIKNLSIMYVNSLKNQDGRSSDMYDFALSLLTGIDDICQRRGRY